MTREIQRHMVDKSLRSPVIESEPSPARDHPADRIFLSNYVRDIEIGAYAEERGVTQRVRIDVTLEVTRNTAHIDDRAERVVNYDDLVGAIEDLINGPRMNLLETFAERLAQACLIDPRARRVHIRIEKLDRLGGAGLGVEIVRVREPESNEKVWALVQELQNGG